METVSIAGYKIDRQLLMKVPYRNDCAKMCSGKCCQGGVTISAEEMNGIYAHMEDVKKVMRPFEKELKSWFKFENEAFFDEDRPGLRGVYGATRVDKHPNVTDADFVSVIAEEEDRGKHQACIFLTLDRRCALQVYSEQAGRHKWQWKPFYCWLFPLTAEEGTITVDERSIGMCFMPSDQAVPFHSLVKQELTHLIGEEGYREMEKLALLAKVSDGR